MAQDSTETIEPTMDIGVSEVQAAVAELWNLNGYSAAFKGNELESRDFAHALLHVTKAAGQLATVVDNLDHGVLLEVTPHDVMLKLADLVICAARMANTLPDRLKWEGYTQEPVTVLARYIHERLHIIARRNAVESKK
jgi:hypothetical protein